MMSIERARSVNLIFVGFILMLVPFLGFSGLVIRVTTGLGGFLIIFFSLAGFRPTHGSSA